MWKQDLMLLLSLMMETNAHFLDPCFMVPIDNVTDTTTKKPTRRTRVCRMVCEYVTIQSFEIIGFFLCITVYCNSELLPIAGGCLLLQLEHQNLSVIIYHLAIIFIMTKRSCEKTSSCTKTRFLFIPILCQSKMIIEDRMCSFYQ